MNLIVTGTPGTGKTTIAKILAKKLGLEVINEKNFALQNKIGKFNESNELEIPIKELEKKANLFLKKNKNIIFEGHVLCEAKIKADFVILLTIPPEELEERLLARNYPTEKIMDNVFCEGIEYCKKHTKRNYSKSRIIEIRSMPSKEATIFQILTALKGKIKSKTKK